MSELFDQLKQQARISAARAYAPYSQFQVGAAIATADGQVFAGCNVENASYGLAICAERNAITTAVTAGIQPGELRELVLFIDREELFSPCGACRQVISEFMPANAVVTAVNNKDQQKQWTVAELLPDGFTLTE